MTASSPSCPVRFCSRTLSAKTQGWPARILGSAAALTRRRRSDDGLLIGRGPPGIGGPALHGVIACPKQTLPGAGNPASEFSPRELRKVAERSPSLEHLAGTMLYIVELKVRRPSEVLPAL